MPTSVSFQEGVNYLELLPKVLARKDSRSVFIQNLFWGVLVREMFRRMHRSFKIRSEGGADELGTWRPLKPRTIQIKKNLGFDKTASTINVRTKALLNSYKPGTVSNGYLYSGPDQLVQMNAYTLTLGTKLPYAHAVNSLRSIFPAVPRKWVVESVEAALRAIAPMIKDFK
mgnify:CR=1 FL=1